jgi:hypothetical protein
MPAGRQGVDLNESGVLAEWEGLQRQPAPPASPLPLELAAMTDGETILAWRTLARAGRDRL